MGRVLAPDSWSSVVACGLLAVVALVVVARLGLRPLTAAPALLSVVAAALAGALAVNVSYDYYQHWSDALADVRGSVPGSPVPLLTRGGHGSASGGRLVSVDLGVRGAARPAVVWLPPAYADPAHAGEKFPVLLLLHGDPGRPQGYVYGMHVDRVADALTAAGRLPATVVVMPTVSEGWPGQQCLDAVRGPDDETYLTRDLPAALRTAFRVDPPGPSWVVAGLSEGGYCAADLALRHPGMFAGAGLLDGYYAPVTSGGLGSRLFGKPSAADRAKQVDATPLLTVRAAPRGSLAFWVMHGTANHDDLVQARAFSRAATADGLPVRQVTVLGGAHSTPAWRTALPDLLAWATTLAAQGRAGTGSVTLPLAA